MGKDYRYAKESGSFSWDLRYDSAADAKNYLRVTYSKADEGKIFDIYINEEFFKEEHIHPKSDAEFLTQTDEIDFSKFLNGNKLRNRQGQPVLRVKFAALHGETAKVFGNFYLSRRRA